MNAFGFMRILLSNPKVGTQECPLIQATLQVESHLVCLPIPAEILETHLKSVPAHSRPSFVTRNVSAVRSLTASTCTSKCHVWTTKNSPAIAWENHPLRFANGSNARENDNARGL